MILILTKPYGDTSNGATRKVDIPTVTASSSRRSSLSKELRNIAAGSLGRGYRSITITFGVAGLAIFNIFRAIDTTSYNTVSFWVKGEEGGETFDIGFVDQSMNNLETDVVYLGSVQLFLPKGITKEWQRVAIPLCAIESVNEGYIDVQKLGGVILNARNRQRSTIFLEDIEFRREPKLEHDYLCVQRNSTALKPKRP